MLNGLWIARDFTRNVQMSLNISDFFPIMSLQYRSTQQKNQCYMRRIILELLFESNKRCNVLR
jgi:hypothetical protein